MADDQAPPDAQVGITKRRTSDIPLPNRSGKADPTILQRQLNQQAIDQMNADRAVASRTPTSTAGKISQGYKLFRKLGSSR